MSSSGGGQRWSGPLLAVATVVLVWAVPEAVTRVVDPPLRQYRAIYFGGDPNSPRLFMTDPVLFWKLRPNVDLEFLDTRVRTDAAGFRSAQSSPGRRIILALGDSTPFGWSVEGDETFSSQLQRLLSDRAGNSDWAVLNGGVPGYTSFQAQRAAQDLLPAIRPEVLILCIGNNEAAPSGQEDAQIAHAGRFLAPIAQLVSSSHFAVWLTERFAAPPAQHPPAAWDRRTRRVSLIDFGANLRGVIRRARDSGARVILMSPPVNLFAPPKGIPLLPDSATIVHWCEGIVARIDGGDARGALAETERVLTADRQAFYARWLRGYALTQLGDRQSGVGEIEQALEDDPFADRSPLSYRRALAQVAAEERVSFLDTNDVLQKASGSTVDAMFADHCHPNAAGHRVIAAALADLVAQADR